MKTNLDEGDISIYLRNMSEAPVANINGRLNIGIINLKSIQENLVNVVDDLTIILAAFKLLPKNVRGSLTQISLDAIDLKKQLSLLYENAEKSVKDYNILYHTLALELLNNE